MDKGVGQSNSRHEKKSRDSLLLPLLGKRTQFPLPRMKKLESV